MDAANIGTAVLRLREKSGLTQKQLAKALHVTDKAVSRWENGYGLPDISILPRIADTFGITVDALYCRADSCAASAALPCDTEAAETLNESTESLKASGGTAAEQKKEEACGSVAEPARDKNTGGLKLTQITINQYTAVQVIMLVAVIFFMLFNSCLSVKYNNTLYTFSAVPLYGDEYYLRLSGGLQAFLSVMCPAFVAAVITLAVYMIIKAVHPDAGFSFIPNIVLCAANGTMLVFSLIVCAALNGYYGNNAFRIPVTYYFVCALSGALLIFAYLCHSHSRSKRQKRIITAITVSACVLILTAANILHSLTYVKTPEYAQSAVMQTANFTIDDNGNYAAGMIVLEGNALPQEMYFVRLKIDGETVTDFEAHQTVRLGCNRYRTENGYAMLISLHNLKLKTPAVAGSSAVFVLFIDNIYIDISATVTADGTLPKSAWQVLPEYEKALGVKHEVKY